jgi:hypothetical protein
MMNAARKGDVALPVTLAEASALTRLVAMVKERKDKPFCGDFGKFERELKERLQEVGRELVSDELAKADVDAPAVRVGTTDYRRVLGSTETYITTFGDVSVYRTLYKDRNDPLEHAVAMLDLRVGIMAGLWTPEAAKQATWVVAQMTPGLTEELFKRVGNMTPSKSSLDRLPKKVSERWEEDRKAFEDQLRGTLVVPKDAASVAVSLDGVLAPMNDVENAGVGRSKEEGNATGGPAGYKEVGCATVTFYDEAGDMLSAIRFARMPQEKKADLKEMLLAEMAVVYEQRPDLQIVKVADAAKDNWTFLTKRVRVGKEVVDYYHATEHLNVALQAAYGEGTGEQRRKFTELADVLLTEPDGVDRVIATLRDLHEAHPTKATKKKAVLKRETAFFAKNKRRMRYAALRASYLPVGSGPQEAACKTVVAQRMKQSGMRWGMEGGQAILTTRGWSQSDRFDQAWALLAATYQVEVTVMTNVVDLATHRKHAKTRSR